MKQLLLILITISSMEIQSQQSGFSLSGFLIDGFSHGPVADAAVVIKGTTDTVYSDSEGRFTVNLSGSGPLILLINSDEYYPQEESILLPLTSEEEIIIHLSPRFTQTPAVIITGQNRWTKLEEFYKSSGQLNGRELNKRLGATLAATLKDEAGIAVRSMGPAPSRPVIRGMSGERVAITQDGAKSVDLSSTSPDHALTLDPFTIENIEVLKGPAILTKASSASGGLIDVKRNDIPDKLPKHITMVSGAFFESSSNNRSVTATAEIPFNHLALHTEFSLRKADDLTTPRGKAVNTDSELQSYAFGGSYIFQDGFAGANIREYSTDYGVPGGFVGAHPNGVDISIFKRENNFIFRRNINNSFIREFEIAVHRNYFHQIEYETKDIIGAEFALNALSGSTELKVHNDLLGSDDRLGINFEVIDFKPGGFVFTAPALSKELASFYYGSAEIYDYSFEWALRYVHKQYHPDKSNKSSKAEYLVDRHFNSISGSFAVLYSLSINQSAGLNISSSSRIPSLEELYNEGPHLAAYTYETGNPSLGIEKCYSAEIYFSQKRQDDNHNMTLYYNFFDSYISPRNTGKINYAKLLPVYNVTGEPAILYGVELKSTMELIHNMFLNVSASYTEGYYQKTRSPLPAIPPLRLKTELNFKFGTQGVNFEIDCANGQNRVDKYETPTKGYFIINAGYQSTMQFWGHLSSLNINLENLLNTEYRNHLSRLKAILPEAGRNVRMVYKLYI